METSEINYKKVNPVQKASFLSQLTFLYMLPIFKRSFRKELDEDDLFKPLDEHKAGLLGKKLEHVWKEKNIKHKKYALHLALWKIFGFQFMGFGFLRLFDEIMMEIVPPFCISRLLNYYEDKNTDVSETEAYLQFFAIVLALLVNALLTHPPYMGLMHLTMKMRVACSSLIYRKMLTLSKAALANTTAGQIINLLSNDVSKFDQGFMLAHYIWIAPIHAVVGTYFLYRQIGVSAFFGVALLTAFIPVQILLGKRTSVLRLRTALRTDERVRLINEIISGIQVIKMYCWEKPFGRLVSVARRKEMAAVRNRAFIQGTFYAFEASIARAAVFVSILGFVLMGSSVTAVKVFTIKAIYDVLRSVLVLHFWISASSIAETNVSVLRIQKFLASADQGHEGTTKSDFPPRIQLQNVSAKWLEENSEASLKNISLKIETNQVVAVIGPVGSGKSSLLNAFLKELPVKSGKLDVQGTLSYSSQEPWLFSGSVRQNIVFNNEYDEERYRKVVEVCALKSDFNLFPFGDQTLVGERGKSLSGGQKARINLARCVYNNADIYLLDDPLSAVDANVGKHLYDKCIREFLKDKICVLVTHQLQYLNNIDRIFIMKNGEIESEGTFAELQTKGLDFGKLLQQFQNEDDNANSEKADEEEEEQIAENEKQLSEKEKMGTGSISLPLYWKYLKAGGGTLMALLLLALFLGTQGVANAGDYYITYWVNSEQRFSELVNNVTESNETLDRDRMIYTYSGLITATIILSFTEALYFMFHFTIVSINLHEMSLSKLLNTTMRFFNNNPSGRILNRFSKDLGYIDEYIPSVLFDVIQVALMLLGSLVLSFIIFVWLLIPAACLITVFFFLRIIYIRTSRSVKRIEAITRSPILGHATTSLQGLSTIRTFSAQDVLTREFDDYQDNHSSAWFLFIAANRCFGFWVDLICIIFFGIAVFVLMFFSNDIRGGDLGLVITQYTIFISSLQWELRQLSELENSMISVERLLEYKNLESEPNRNKTKEMSENWSPKGKIEFREVSMKYNPSDSYILKNLNFTVYPGEKIGIVGRTGAGKSSVITALFQLYPTEGSILIDEIKSTDLPLDEVRSKISIIPQEPVLFSGSLRKNLDPFEEYSDEVIWNALDQVELKEVVSEAMGGLNASVSESGGNFSVGQRQLICLARALVRRNKILVMDEATANVDPQTDMIIQNTIREKFAECTVLTVAHRLHTVMDSDRIIVMSAGCVEEFDHPYNLLRNEDGALCNLVKNMGKAVAASLENIAKISYEKKIRVAGEAKQS